MGCNCKTDALIKHVRGNVLRLAIPLSVKIRDLVDGQPTERVEDFYPDASRGVKIVLDASYITRTFDGAVSGNVVSMEDGGTLKLGYYQVEVLCYDNNGIPYRYMARNIIAIVDATADAGIEADIEFDSETYTLEGAYFIKGEKGDKGDPFTYDDFTPEQIAELQRPATEAAERAGQAISEINTLEQQVEAKERQRETAETERQQSEAARQTQEATRQSAEQSRAQGENTRNSNETTRQSNEQQRQQNEAQRALQATADHSRALSDHERAGGDHAASVNATESANNAAVLANEKAALAQEVASHPDMVGDNGNWWRWNTDDDEYQDTGVPALNVVTYDINGSTGELQMTVIDGMDYPHMEVVEGNLVLEVNS